MQHLEKIKILQAKQKEELRIEKEEGFENFSAF